MTEPSSSLTSLPGWAIRQLPSGETAFTCTPPLSRLSSWSSLLFCAAIVVPLLAYLLGGAWLESWREGDWLLFATICGLFLATGAGLARFCLESVKVTVGPAGLCRTTRPFSWFQQLLPLREIASIQLADYGPDQDWGKDGLRIEATPAAEGGTIMLLFYRPFQAVGLRPGANVSNHAELAALLVSKMNESLAANAPEEPGRQREPEP